MPIDNEEPVIKMIENVTPNVSAKRKAPSDENYPNSMEKDDEIFSNEASVGNLSLSGVTECCDKSNIIVVDKSIKETTFCTNTSNRVTVIDLCSSDEEENSITSALSDENRDPLKYIADDVTKSLLQNFSSTKHQLSTRPTDQLGGWLSDNIINSGSETCTSKYCSTIFNARTNMSPILRPAP